MNRARLRAPGRSDSISGVSRSFAVPPATGIEPSAPIRGRSCSIAAAARASSGTLSRKSSANFTQYEPSWSGRPSFDQHHSVARRSQGSPEPASHSFPASANVRCEPPSDGTIHGACGRAAAVGMTNGTPPSGAAMLAIHSAAPATSGSSSAPIPDSTSSAWRVAAGSLSGARTSGSRA